jgi:rhodanese-related sulfurtransferase
MPETISRDELEQLVGRGATTVVEALPEQYFAEEHLPGAVNVPHDAPRERIEALLPDRSAPVVTYCASLTCQNSAQLAQRLTAMGYTNVRDYAEGKADWIEHNLPTERSVTSRAA